MAEKRMFAKSIVTSAEFLSLKVSARELYFQLGLQADDDGILNNTEIIMRMIGAKKADYTALVQGGYLINVRKGIDVISDWNVNNYIRNDRYKETLYKAEKSRLKNVSGRYVLMDDGIHDGIPKKIPNGIPEVSADKNRVEEIKKEECESREAEPIPADKAHTRKPYGEYGHILLSDLEIDDLIKSYGEYKVRTAIYCLDSYCEESGKSYKSYKTKIENLGFKMVEDRKYSLPRKFRSEEFSLEASIKSDIKELSDEEWKRMMNILPDDSLSGNTEDLEGTGNTENDIVQKENTFIPEEYSGLSYNRELECYESTSVDDSEDLPFS